MPDFSFKKGEKLSSRKEITSLFRSGRVLVSHPIRIIYDLSHEGDFPARVAISVPKRLFKRAVDRNLLKRRIREIYRQHKPGFYHQLNEMEVRIHMVIQVHHAGIVDYHLLEQAVQRGIEKVERDLEKQH
jgi:ribonuclease P protein component